MANRWYVKQDGQELGPFSDSGLQRFLASGQAQPGVLVRNGSASEWLAPTQLGIAADASVAAAPVRSSNASSGKPAEIVEPIVNLSLAPGPKPFWSRPATWAAAGAGIVALLLAACVGAWFSAKHLNGERHTSAAPASPATNPAVADLEQETKRLRQDLAELQNKMREPPAPESKPPRSDLADERAALGKEIALEMASQEDLQERFNYEMGLQTEASDARIDLPPYQSQRDARYAIHLPVVELELSKLDRAGLSARRAAFEQAASNRAKRIEQLHSRVGEAVAALDVGQAGQTLKQFLPLADGDEYDRGLNLLRQLPAAQIEKLLDFIRAMPVDARQALAEKGPAPVDLMRQFDDPDLVRVLKTRLPHLAALVAAEADDDAWQLLGEEALRNRDLTTLRRWAFLQQAFSAKLDRRLTQERVADLVDAFGVFRLAGEPSLGGGLLTTPAEAESAFRNGRKLAGDAWPPDEPPHPVAGHWAWTGVMPCKMYVNPTSDEIMFVQPDGETFVQRICKIGPDYLVAYELRWRVEGSGELPDHGLTGVVPFGGVMEPESKTNLDPIMPYSDYGHNVYFVLTLYRRPGKASRKLKVFRTEMQGETLTKETLLAPDGGFWSKLGVAAEYRPETNGFRRVNDKLKP